MVIFHSYVSLPEGSYHFSYWKWWFIVDFPIKNGGSFHSYVSLPEGIPLQISPRPTSQADPFGCSFGALADADGQAALRSAELTLPALVSGEAARRQAATEAKKELQLMLGPPGTSYFDIPSGNLT